MKQKLPVLHFFERVNIGKFLVKNLVLIFSVSVLFDVKENYANFFVPSTNHFSIGFIHKNAQLGTVYLNDAPNNDIDCEKRSLPCSDCARNQ
ncbi:hypothetical protein [Streptococcus parasuis]|uniref:hypothetical protein n=1 Tax=Streptococcus parasuis TaxID=1501662 RepID=UPI0024127B5E|nr:hypothetical protein [Streptococcus parasuis]MDG4477208.1 hypothetical protein [Streptococcus parasuis]